MFVVFCMPDFVLFPEALYQGSDFLHIVFVVLERRVSECIYWWNLTSFICFLCIAVIWVEVIWYFWCLAHCSVRNMWCNLVAQFCHCAYTRIALCSTHGMTMCMQCILDINLCIVSFCSCSNQVYYFCCLHVSYMCRAQLLLLSNVWDLQCMALETRVFCEPSKYIWYFHLCHILSVFYCQVCGGLNAVIIILWSCLWKLRDLCTNIPCFVFQSSYCYQEKSSSSVTVCLKYRITLCYFSRYIWTSIICQYLHYKLMINFYLDICVCRSCVLALLALWSIIDSI
jgi:hypothetical protein